MFIKRVILIFAIISISSCTLRGNMDRIPQQFSIKINEFIQHVEQEADVSVVFLDKKNDVSEIVRISGRNKEEIEAFLQNSIAGLMTPYNPDETNRFILIDLESYNSETHDNYIAHELGHIIIQMSFRKVLAKESKYMGWADLVDNILTDWQVDNYIQENGFNITEQLDAIHNNYIKRLKEKDDDQFLQLNSFLIQALINDQLSQDVKNKFVVIYTNNYKYPDDLPHVFSITSEINSAKEKYDKEKHLYFADKLLRAFIPEKIEGQIAYIQKYSPK